MFDYYRGRCTCLIITGQVHMFDCHRVLWIVGGTGTLWCFGLLYFQFSVIACFHLYLFCPLDVSLTPHFVTSLVERRLGTTVRTSPRMRYIFSVSMSDIFRLLRVIFLVIS